MDEAKMLLSNILSLGDWATWKNCIDQVEDCIKSVSYTHLTLPTTPYV